VRFRGGAEWQERRNDGTAVRVVARLLGQVKKSEKPWIVFVDRAQSRFEDGLENLLRVTVEETRWMVGAVLREHSPTLQNGRVASGIHEAFKKPTDASRWYSAFVSVCKACETAHEMTAGTGTDVIAQLVKPVVVLDGLLVEAFLARRGARTHRNGPRRLPVRIPER
jgi:transposase-like protein